MKRFFVLVFCLSLFGCAFADNRYLKITNNTDKAETVCFDFSNNGFILGAGKSIELVCNGYGFRFNCSYGVMSHYGELSEDTTLEINPDCYYVGNEKFYYWTEGR